MADDTQSPFVVAIQRVAGAVAGGVAFLLRSRKAILFDPTDFDVDDVPDMVLQGTAQDPGIVSGYLRVRARAGGSSAIRDLGNVSGSVALNGATGARSFRINATGNVTFATPVGFSDGNEIRVKLTGSDVFDANWAAAFVFPTSEADAGALTGIRFGLTADVWEFVLDGTSWVCRSHVYY